MRLYTINGIRDSAATTTDQMGAALRERGYEWTKVELPVTRVWNARWLSWTQKIAREEIPSIEPGGVAVAHSHGCMVTWAMMDYHQRAISDIPLFERVVMLAPAMGRGGPHLFRSWEWERLNFERLLCVCNPADRAVMAGAINPLPFHPFGWAGCYGFSTDDPRVENRVSFSYKGFFNHSAPYFAEPYLSTWAEKIDKFFTRVHAQGGA